jgi:hypothetical protein
MKREWIQSRVRTKCFQFSADCSFGAEGARPGVWAHPGSAPVRRNDHDLGVDSRSSGFASEHFYNMTNIDLNIHSPAQRSVRAGAQKAISCY